MARLRGWLRLCRAEYWGFAVTAPFGALIVAGASLPPATFAALLAVNALTIAWGFAHNDWCDLALDARAADKEGRSIVAGQVRPGEALAIALLLASASVLLTAFRWPAVGPLAVLGCAMAATALYNRFGKSFPGGDVFYGLAGGLMFLLGAVVAAPGHDLAALSTPVWALFLVQVLNHVYFNAVNGGVKDLVSDHRLGVPTMAVRWSRVEGRHIRIGWPFRALALGLSTAVLGLTAWALLSGILEWHVWQGVAMALCAVASLRLTWQLLMTTVHDRQRIANLLTRREMATTAVLMLLLPAHVGPAWLAMLVAIPMAWFTMLNRFLNGTYFRMPGDY